MRSHFCCVVLIIQSSQFWKVTLKKRRWHQWRYAWGKERCQRCSLCVIQEKTSSKTIFTSYHSCIYLEGKDPLNLKSKFVCSVYRSHLTINIIRVTLNTEFDTVCLFGWYARISRVSRLGLETPSLSVQDSSQSRNPPRFLKVSKTRLGLGI